MAIDHAWPFGFLLRYNEKYGGNKKRSGIFVFDVGLVLNFNISFINLKWRFVLRRDSLPPTVRPIEVCPHHTHHRWFKIAKQLTENVYQPGPTHSSNNMCLILILARSLHHKTAVAAFSKLSFYNWDLMGLIRGLFENVRLKLGCLQVWWWKWYIERYFHFIYDSLELFTHP